jgi:hypothetical protein
MQDTYEFPAERPGTGQPGEARAAGLRLPARLVRHDGSTVTAAMELPP